MPSSWMNSRDFFLTRSLTFLGVTWARVLRLGGDYQLLGAHSEYLGAWLLQTSSPAGDGSTRPGGGADQAWSGRSCWTASLSCLGTLSLSLSPSPSLSLSLSFSSAKRSAIGHIKMKMRLQYIASINKNKSRLAELLAGFRGKIPKRLRHRRCFSQSNIILLFFLNQI